MDAKLWGFLGEEMATLGMSPSLINEAFEHAEEAADYEQQRHGYLPNRISEEIQSRLLQFKIQKIDYIAWAATACEQVRKLLFEGTSDEMESTVIAGTLKEAAIKKIDLRFQELKAAEAVERSNARPADYGLRPSIDVLNAIAKELDQLHPSSSEANTKKRFKYN